MAAKKRPQPPRRPRELSGQERVFLANFRDGFVVPHEYEAELLKMIEALTGELWLPHVSELSKRPGV